MIYDIEQGHSEIPVIVDPNDATKLKKLDVEKLNTEDLLKPVFRDGKLIFKCPELTTIQDVVKKEISQIKRRSIQPPIHTRHNFLEKRS